MSTTLRRLPLHLPLPLLARSCLPHRALELPSAKATIEKLSSPVRRSPDSVPPTQAWLNHINLLALVFRALTCSTSHLNRSSRRTSASRRFLSTPALRVEYSAASAGGRDMCTSSPRSRVTEDVDGLGLVTVVGGRRRGRREKEGEGMDGYEAP